MELQPHQQRVIDEKSELDEKRGELEAFLRTAQSPAAPMDEQKRMNRQLEVMSLYSAILDERIAQWGSPDDEMVVFLQDRAPCDTDPLAQGVEVVAIPVDRLAAYGIPPLHNSSEQRVLFRARGQLAPDVRVL